MTKGLSISAALAMALTLSAFAEDVDIGAMALRSQGYGFQITAGSTATELGVVPDNLLAGGLWLSKDQAENSIKIFLDPAWMTGVVVRTYTLVCKNDGTYPARIPKKFKFLGSNDGSNWTVLDTVADATSLWESIESGTKKQLTRTIAEPGEYCRYCVYLEQPSGSGSYKYSLNRIGLSGDAVYLEDGLEDFTAKAREQGVMSISASSDYQDNAAYHVMVFDGDAASAGLSGASLTQSLTCSVDDDVYEGSRTVRVYEFSSPVASGSSSYVRLPTAWTLEGSDNPFATDDQWTMLDTRTGVDWSRFYDLADGNMVIKRFAVASPGKFSCYRFKFTARNGSGGSAIAYRLSEIRLLAGGNDEPEIEIGDFSSRAFRYYSRITFPGAGETAATNVPVMLKLSPETIPGFSYGQFATGDSTLRLVGVDRTLLPIEIDYWNTNGTSCLWTKVPELSNRTALRLYWGVKDPLRIGTPPQKKTIWSDYRAVWHFSSNGDSVGGKSVIPSVSTLADSPLGRCYGGASISVPSFDLGTDFSFSCWFRPAVAMKSYYGGRLFKGKTLYDGDGFDVLFLAGSDYETISMRGGGVNDFSRASSAGWFAVGDWHHVTAEWNGTYGAVYVDGELYFESDGFGTPDSTAVASWIIASDCGGATVDELRIRTGSSTPAQISAEYQSAAVPDYIRYSRATTPNGLMVYFR